MIFLSLTLIINRILIFDFMVIQNQFPNNKDKLNGVESKKYKPVSDSTKTQFQISFVESFER